MIYERLAQKNIENRLFGGKTIIIYGARQVGKTTLVRELAQKYQGHYLLGDNIEVSNALSHKNAHQLKDFIGDHKLVIIDEAQRIPDIGLSLKLLADNYPQIQIIATGSSSFDLANKISEPLTGRAWLFNLYPLAFSEVAPHYPGTPQSVMQRMLRYGSFPDIWNSPDSDAEIKLETLGTDFLFKDILQFQQLKKSSLLLELLQALALQLGNEVSYTELANLLRTNTSTIERYIFLLEQVFIIFRLPMLKRNPRTEVGKLRKIYFYDLGLRNALIRNFNALALRNDLGALWENFCIIERMKHASFTDYRPNYYFWRSYSQKEIDLVEEHSGSLRTFEFKWRGKAAKQPTEFAKLYPNSPFTEVNVTNFTHTLYNQ